MRRSTLSNLTAAVSLLVGCGTTSQRVQKPATPIPFRDLYEAAEPQLKTHTTTSGGDLSFRVESMPLQALLLHLAERSGQSIVWDQSLDGETVSLSMHQVNLGEALSAIARRLNTDVSRSGDTWFLGSLRAEDFAAAALRVRRLNPDDVKAFVQGVTKGATTATATADGLLIVVDRTEVVRKLVDLVHQLDSVESVTWVCQFWIVSLNAEDLYDLGLDVNPTVNVAAALAGASGGFALPVSGTQAAAGLDVTLRAIASGSAGQLLADPLMLLVDGSEARLHRGERFTVRTATVQTTEGSTTTQQGLQTIEAGLSLSATAREVSPSLCRLSVDLQLSDVTGFRDGVPQLKTEDLNAQADLASGGVYLLGSLKRQARNVGWSRALQLGTRRTSSDSVLQVWSRIYRVGSRGVTNEETQADRRAATTARDVLRDVRAGDAPQQATTSHDLLGRMPPEAPPLQEERRTNPVHPTMEIAR